MPSPRLFLSALLFVSCTVHPERSRGAQLRVYRVGDETLSHVALKTGVSVARLRSLNHLRGDSINWGTGLLVPETEKTLGLPVWPTEREGGCRAEETVELTFGLASWKSEVFPVDDHNAFRHARVDLDGDGESHG